MLLFYIFIVIVLLCIFYYFYSKKSPNYLKGIDVVYWINLDRARERKINMKKMFTDMIFNNCNIQRIQAVDGKDQHIETIIKNDIYETNTSSNDLEYACLLSHLHTIREFSESNYEIALVLEDDMTLEYKSKWKTTIENIIQDAPKDWEIIQLCYIIKNKIPDETYTLNKENFHSTGAYIINIKAAKRFMKHIFIENKYKLDVNISHNADIYLYKEFMTYTYKYPFFIYHTNNESYIHPEHVEFIHNRSKHIIEDRIYN